MFLQYKVDKKGLYEIKDLKELGQWDIYLNNTFVTNMKVIESYHLDVFTTKKKKITIQNFSGESIEIPFSTFDKLKTIPFMGLVDSQDFLNQLKSKTIKSYPLKNKSIMTKRLKENYFFDLNGNRYFFSQKLGVLPSLSLNKVVSDLAALTSTDSESYSLDNLFIYKRSFLNILTEKQYDLKDNEIILKDKKSIDNLFGHWQDNNCEREEKRDYYQIKKSFYKKSYLGSISLPDDLSISPSNTEIVAQKLIPLENDLTIQDDKVTVNQNIKEKKLCLYQF